jgi:hypothetical protein
MDCGSGKAHLVRQNPVANHRTSERIVFVVQIIVGGWIIQHARQQLGQPERKKGRNGTNDKVSGVSSVCQLSALDSGVLLRLPRSRHACHEACSQACLVEPQAPLCLTLPRSTRKFQELLSCTASQVQEDAVLKTLVATLNACQQACLLAAAYG